MAAKTFTMTCADDKAYTFTREKAQGRKPRGMERWNGYISSADLDALRASALPPYITVSSQIQDAIRNYVRMQLVNT